MSHHKAAYHDPAPIELERWVPNPEKPGYIVYDGSPTWRQVFKELEQRAEAAGLVDEYLSLGIRHYDKPDICDQPFPRSGPEPGQRRWIAVFPVEGGSEGWYIHIEVIDVHGNRTLFALLKTLNEGRDRAWEIAKGIGEILGI